jgi:hypothetical protein
MGTHGLIDYPWPSGHAGTRHDGNPLDLRGVIINGVVNDRIAWARLYLEPPFEDAGNIDRGVDDMIEGN